MYTVTEPFQTVQRRFPVGALISDEDLADSPLSPEDWIGLGKLEMAEDPNNAPEQGKPLESPPREDQDADKPAEKPAEQNDAETKPTEHPDPAADAGASATGNLTDAAQNKPADAPKPPNAT